MSIKLIGAWIGGAVLALSFALANGASPYDQPQMQMAGDMNVYLGVMSANAIRAQPTVITEEQMHGGIPGDKNAYHVLVTLFDRQSNERIEDATVSAVVRPLGLGGAMRPMEIMYSAGVACYCNWFDMAAGETYRISVVIERPGKPAEHVQFDYTPE